MNKLPKNKPGTACTIVSPEIPHGYTLYFLGENDPGDGQLSTVECWVQNQHGEVWMCVWLFGRWSGWYRNDKEGQNKMYELLSRLPLATIKRALDDMTWSDSHRRPA